MASPKVTRSLGGGDSTVTMRNVSKVLGDEKAAEYCRVAFGALDPELVDELAQQCERGRASLYFAQGRGFILVGVEVATRTLHIMAAQHWGFEGRLYSEPGMATINALAKVEGCEFIEVQAVEPRSEAILARYGFVAGIRYTHGLQMKRVVL